MSELSAQCDELRERAKVLRQGRWSDGADDVRLMDDAADTICELAGGTRTARRVIVSDPSTDCATGHCECGGCGGGIDPWDEWCRHCGARLEDA